MTDSNEFLNQAEHDLRTTRRLGAASKSAFANLPAESRAAFQQAMIFLGADVALLGNTHQTSPTDRAAAAALMFLKLEIDTQEPKWSSWMLERMIDAVLHTPDGGATDLIRGFDLALKKYDVRLTQTLANLVKDLVVLTFTKAGASYQTANWEWANKGLAAGVNAARCYLFLHALPADHATASAIVAVLRGLAETPFSKQAADILAADLERADVKPLLRGIKIPA